MSDGTQSSLFSRLFGTFVSKLIGGIAGLVVLAMGAWLGIDSFILLPEKRVKLANEFSPTSLAYVEFAKKAWLDVYQRGHRDNNKSKNQRHWEDELWTKLLILFKDAERLCPHHKTQLAIQQLKCANTKSYAFYEVVEEQQPLSETVNRKRLQEDCGTSGWPLLNEDVTPTSPAPALEATFSNLYGDLKRTQEQAVKAVYECAGL